MKLSLKPGARRPFRAEVGHDHTEHVTVSLYAVASFTRPSPASFNAAHAWELKQAALAINAAVDGAGASVENGAVRTMLPKLERELVVDVCRRFGWWKGGRL